MQSCKSSYQIQISSNRMMNLSTHPDRIPGPQSQRPTLIDHSPGTHRSFLLNAEFFLADALPSKCPLSYAKMQGYASKSQCSSWCAKCRDMQANHSALLDVWNAGIPTTFSGCKRSALLDVQNAVKFCAPYPSQWCFIYMKTGVLSMPSPCFFHANRSFSKQNELLLSYIQYAGIHRTFAVTPSLWNPSVFYLKIAVLSNCLPPQIAVLPTIYIQSQICSPSRRHKPSLRKSCPSH